MAETSWDKFYVFISLIPFPALSIMTTKDAKGSLSASEENNFRVDFFKTRRPNRSFQEEQETLQIKIDVQSSSNFKVS